MKVNGPLQSQEAQGTIADVLTFSKRRSGQQCRYQKKQKDAESSLQLDQREKFFNASLSCRFMDYGTAFFGITIYGSEISLYNEEAKGRKMAGYNLCIKEFLENVA